VFAAGGKGIEAVFPSAGAGGIERNAPPFEVGTVGCWEWMPGDGADSPLLFSISVGIPESFALVA
jgi:hypothetical protein